MQLNSSALIKMYEAGDKNNQTAWLLYPVHPVIPSKPQHLRSAYA